MPGKQADDINYWQNGESGVMATRLVKTTARDATAEGNTATTVDAAATVLLTPGRGGGRMNNKLEPNTEQTMAEQSLPGEYENPYKFNAKELDVETDLYYYGARYYNPRLSVWYGVDPLAEKMPSWSPYSYAFDNPVRYIDPDGRAPMDIIYLNANGTIKRIENNGSKYITVVDTNGKGRLLSSYDISVGIFSSNSRNRQIVANIVAHYGRQTGVDNVGATYERGGIAHFDPSDKGIWIAPNVGGKVSPKLDNKFNLMNTLVHENLHKIDNSNGITPSFLSHSNVYVKQMTDDSFNRTSYDFQLGMVSSLINHLYSAASNKEGNIDNLINEFNQNNNSNWKIAPNITPGKGWRVDYKNKTMFFPAKKLTKP